MISHLEIIVFFLETIVFSLETIFFLLETIIFSLETNVFSLETIVGFFWRPSFYFLIGDHSFLIGDHIDHWSILIGEFSLGIMILHKTKKVLSLFFFKQVFFSILEFIPEINFCP